MSEKTFEELARECGDALLVVRRCMSVGTHEAPEVALGRLGDWCVLLAKPGDIPRTKKRQPSKTRLYLITHVPTGLKLGATLTRKQAFETLNRLAPIEALTSDQIKANVAAIYNAFPEGFTGSIPAPTATDHAVSLRADYDKCINHEAIA